MTLIENRSFDEERAFYGSSGLTVRDCRIEGAADGESAFKECSDITAENCYFDLRYPFWHNNGSKISNSEMTENCRAAVWYSDNITVENTEMHGIKALRECSNIKINGCDIVSPEFGWSVKNISMKDSTVVSEYFMMRSEDLNFDNVELKGKYSFQHIKNSVFDNCIFDTKDAFWHAENVTVKNSVVKGEYLGWYSNGLTFENCKIIGTQPLFYCKALRLENCEMINTDLCFEKSEVEACITTPVDSIKNPLSGRIYLPSLDTLIRDDENSKCEVIICKECSKNKRA